MPSIAKVAFLYVFLIELLPNQVSAEPTNLELAKNLFPSLHEVLVTIGQQANPIVPDSFSPQAFLNGWSEEHFNWLRASMYNHSRLINFGKISEVEIYASLVEVKGSVATKRFIQNHLAAKSAQILGMNESLMFVLNKRMYALCDYLVYSIEDGKLTIEAIMEAKAGHYNHADLSQLQKFINSISDFGLTVPDGSAGNRTFVPENIFLQVKDTEVPIQNLSIDQIKNAVIMVRTTATFSELDFLHVVSFKSADELALLHVVANTLHKKVVAGKDWQARFARAEGKLKGDLLKKESRDFTTEPKFLEAMSAWIVSTRLSQPINPDNCNPKDKPLLLRLIQWLNENKHSKKDSALLLLTMKLTRAAKDTIRNEFIDGNEIAKKLIPDASDTDVLEKILQRTLSDESINIDIFEDTFGREVLIRAARQIYNAALKRATSEGKPVPKIVRPLKNIAESTETSDCPLVFGENKINVGSEN